MTFVVNCSDMNFCLALFHTDNLGCVQYYLAPKVDEDEGEEEKEEAPAASTKAAPKAKTATKGGKASVKEEEDGMEDEDE
jgi:hypothetical protein